MGIFVVTEIALKLTDKWLVCVINFPFNTSPVFRTTTRIGKCHFTGLIFKKYKDSRRYGSLHLILEPMEVEGTLECDLQTQRCVQTVTQLTVPII